MAFTTHTELTDCKIGSGPGVRDSECGLCRVEIEVNEGSITHDDGKCLNTWHQGCLESWHTFCKDQTAPQSTCTTCPVCRANLWKAPLKFYHLTDYDHDFTIYPRMPGWHLVVYDARSLGTATITVVTTHGHTFLLTDPNDSNTMGLHGFVVAPYGEITTSALFRAELHNQPSRWHVFDSSVELETFVGTDVFQFNQNGEVIPFVASLTGEGVPASLSVQDQARVRAWGSLEVTGYTFPGFSQMFIAPRMPNNTSVNNEQNTLRLFPSYEALTALWNSVYLYERFANLNTTDVTDLLADYSARFVRDTKSIQILRDYRQNNVQAWDVYAVYGTNIHYVVPARDQSVRTNPRPLHYHRLRDHLRGRPF